MLGTIFINATKVLCLMVVLCMSSCKPEDLGFGNIPEIKFENIETIEGISGNDSLVILSFYYQDGDGNIGLSEFDTASPFNYGSPYFHNLPITFMVKDGGNFREIKHPVTGELYGNQHERIPVLTPEGKHKSISGVIRLELTANPFQTTPNEVMFEFKLLDRDLNVSNTVISPSIVLAH